MTSHLNHTALVSTIFWTYYQIKNFTLPWIQVIKFRVYHSWNRVHLSTLPSCKKIDLLCRNFWSFRKICNQNIITKLVQSAITKKNFNSEITVFWSTQFLKIENNLKKCKNWPVFLENISYFSIMSQRRRYLHNWLSFSYFFCIKTIQLWKSEERITPNFRSLLTDKQMHPEGEGYF